MNENRHLRVGVIGVGSMGAFHARELAQGVVARRQARRGLRYRSRRARSLRSSPLRRREHAASLGPRRRGDDRHPPLRSHAHRDRRSRARDARPLREALGSPQGRLRADDRRLRARPQKSQVFAEMFQHRTDPPYRKLKEMISSGELGEIRRINWIVTDWFRTVAYYQSGGWRATWRGEGGGVLLNQCPHNLDLCSGCRPALARSRVLPDRALPRHRGRRRGERLSWNTTAAPPRDFVTTTGEAPGTNRLEVAGERGKVVLEGDRFSFTRNEVPMSEYSRTTSERFTPPPVWNITIPCQSAGTRHRGIWQNFVSAVLDGEPLIRRGRRYPQRRARQRNSPFGIGPVKTVAFPSMLSRTSGRSRSEPQPRATRSPIPSERDARPPSGDISKFTLQVNLRQTSHVPHRFCRRSRPDIDGQIAGHTESSVRPTSSRAMSTARTCTISPELESRSPSSPQQASRISCFGSAIANWSKSIEKPFDVCANRGAQRSACARSARASSAS